MGSLFLLQTELRTGQREVYDSFCKGRSAESDGKQLAWRFKVTDQEEHWDDLFKGSMNRNPYLEIGDFVIKEKSGSWSYNFAVGIDDIDQGVNLVIRGEDILSSTSRQLQIKRAIESGFRNVTYGHHMLVMDSDLGVKLSKSERSLRVQQLNTLKLA